MKRRILCGIAVFLLLSLVGLGAAAVEEPKEPDYVWLYLPLEGAPKEEIWLYASGGKLVGRLLTDENGRANSGLLPPGEYYAATLDSCTVFRLEENLDVLVTGGSGHFENGTLYLNP